MDDMMMPAIWAVDCVVIDAGCGGGESWAGMSNLRTIKPSTRVNGMYFGRFGSMRRRLWE